jgi:hypothetical protein
MVKLVPAYSLGEDREFLGLFEDDLEATRATMQTSKCDLDQMFEKMLAQDLFTDDKGNPIRTVHRSRK